jgi:hypothetical protein
MKTEHSKLEAQQGQLDIPVVIQRISELHKEFYEVLESWNEKKTFEKLDRLKDIKRIFKEFKIDWLDDV